MQGRKANPAQQPVEVSFKTEAFDRLNDSAAALAVIQTEQAQAAQALAQQIGYEGALTVGALEDEIRFYQRRSVEAILETGKRLLLLRAMTAHGNSSQIGTNQEFDKRVELLGFSRSTAHRFMQAAAKTAKSPNLGLLATQVKSASAFLELVTHDDDELEALKDIDAIDRMSASELRAALREAKADAEATGQLLADKNKALDKAKAAARRLASAPREEVIAAELAELAGRFHTALAYVRGDLRLGFQKLFDREQDGSTEPGSHRQVMAGYVKEIEHEIAVLKSDFFLFDVPAAATDSVA